MNIKRKLGFGEMVTRIAAVVGIVLATIEISKWLGSPEINLKAKVEFADLSVPPTVDDSFKRIYSLSVLADLKSRTNYEDIKSKYLSSVSIVDDDIVNQIKSLSNDGQRPTALLEELTARQLTTNYRIEDGLDQLLYAFSETIRNELPSGRPSGSEVLRGVWYIEVENSGSRAAKQVIVRAPQAKLISIKREGGSVEILNIDQVIQLGELQPQEAVKITAWTDFSLSRYLADDIRLTHSSGVGTVSVYSALGPFWNLLASWALPVAAGLGCILLSVVWSLFWSAKPARVDELDSNSESDERHIGGET